MKNIKYKLLPLIIVFILVLSPMCVSATGIFNMSGGSSWGKFEKLHFYEQNLRAYIVDICGVMISDVNGGTEQSIRDAWDNYILTNYQISTSESMADYIDSHFTVDESGNEPICNIDATMSDDMHSFMREWIEENTGFYTFYTFDMPELVTYYDNKPQYDAIVGVVNTMLPSQIAVVCPNSYTSVGYYTKISIIEYDGIIFCGDINSNYIIGECNKDWNSSSNNTIDNTVYWIDRYGNDVTDNVLQNGYGYNTETIASGLNVCSIRGCFHGNSNCLNNTEYLVTRNSQAVRAYKTFNEYKRYAVGERAYFTTDKWGNYQSGQGNTITQSELENCNVNYGTIINTVTNEGDGLSEDALQQLIETLLNNNSGGSSGGSVSDNGGSSSGGGLSGLFTGIGAVFDVIMSILGRLLEYVGQALDLFGDTITNLIDRIPTGFTQLLTGLFPFIPEEWVSAIGLSLVLGIIGAVVGIFKK